MTIFDRAPSYADLEAELTAPGMPYEIVEEQVLGRRTRCWKALPPTLRDLLLHTRAFADREFLVFEDERLSYGEAFDRTARLAARMRALGIAKGDRVAVAMRNYPEWPLSFFAAASIGAIVVPLNAWWNGDELRYGLFDSGTRLLFADAERVARIAPQLGGLQIEHVVTVRDDSSPPALPGVAFHRYEDFLAESPAGAELPAVEVAPDDDATIFYTSGTTGAPKGALGTHRNMVTNLGSVGFARARSALRAGETLPPPPGSGPQTAMLISVPFFHVTGSHSIMAAAMFRGQKLVLMYRWNPERALELIEREHIAQFGGVPAMVWQVLESPDLPRRDVSSVQNIAYGGAPAAPELVRRIKQAFPDCRPSNGYGLTETSAVTTTNLGHEYEQKPDSIGRCVAVCDVKVIGDDGAELPPGGVGQLCVRGPNVVKGYWNKPEATAESFRDGWLHTGDVVRMDDEGFIYILDRAKDMLIRGGENIYCVEVENVLYQHPCVMDAAVIGLPHRVLGEEVGAVVQVVEGATVTAQELQTYAGERLAAFKVPVRIELRNEPLPRNANGKILKNQLKVELGVGA